MNMNSYDCCAPNSATSKRITDLGPVLKVIGEDSRLRLLCVLQKDSHCVCELEEHTKLSQSLISHHLKDLKAIGIVSDTKKGQKVYYSLTDFGNSVMKSLLTLAK